MNKRIAILLKMLCLTAGLILVYQLLCDREESREGADKEILNTNGSYTSYDFAMGTSVSVSTYYDSKAQAGDGQETVLWDAEHAAEYHADIVEAVQSLDADVISWRSETSELYELNENYTEQKPYRTGSDLYEALSQAYDICRDSEGALDITIRPLAKLWNIEEADSEGFLVPNREEIEHALANVGYERVTLSAEPAVTLSQPGIILDLGAVGKGYALDKVRDYLDMHGATGAVVSVGGSILLYGGKNDHSDWRVGIRNPQGDMDEMIGYLSFPAGTTVCISTSGDYEKYVMLDGVRYHHILDRSTGCPAESGLSSVTIVCENGLYSDALSTACFVLGYERSLPLLEQYDAEAVFIDKENHITVTAGLKSVFYESVRE